MFAVKNSSNELMLFYDVPKNASTTIKKLFIDHLGLTEDFDFYGEQYIDNTTGDRVDNMDKSKEYKEEKGNKKDFHDFAQNMAFHDPGYNRQYYRLCVVRDPVERFVSCYNHLALVNEEIEHAPEEVLSLVRENKSPNNHFLPQEVFLGRNNRYYDRIYNVDQIFQLEEDLNKFFNKDIRAHHFQTSGSSVEFPVELTDALVEDIKETYKEDYKAFGKYF